MVELEDYVGFNTLALHRLSLSCLLTRNGAAAGKTMEHAPSRSVQCLRPTNIPTLLLVPN